MKDVSRKAAQVIVMQALPRRLTDFQRHKLTKELLDGLYSDSWYWDEIIHRQEEEGNAERTKLTKIANRTIAELNKALRQIETARATTRISDPETLAETISALPAFYDADDQERMGEYLPERYVPSRELADTIEEARLGIRNWLALCSKHHTPTNRGRPADLRVDSVECLRAIAMKGGLRSKEVQHLLTEIRTRLAPDLPTEGAAKKRAQRAGKRPRTK